MMFWFVNLPLGRERQRERGTAGERSRVSRELGLINLG